MERVILFSNCHVFLLTLIFRVSKYTKEKLQVDDFLKSRHVSLFLKFRSQGSVRVLKNLESPGILLWDFPGLESPG